MSSKLVFLLLSALFLVQCSVCKPMPDEDIILSESSLSEEEKELYEKRMIAQKDRLFSLLIDSVNYILKKTVENVNAEEKNSETLTAKVNELKDLTKRLDLVVNSDSLLEKELSLKSVVKDEEAFINSLDENIIEDSIIFNIMDKAAEDMKTKYCENIKKECQNYEQLTNPLGAKPLQVDCISITTNMGCANSDSLQN